MRANSPFILITFTYIISEGTYHVQPAKPSRWWLNPSSYRGARSQSRSWGKSDAGVPSSNDKMGGNCKTFGAGR